MVQSRCTPRDGGTTIHDVLFFVWLIIGLLEGWMLDFLDKLQGDLGLWNPSIPSCHLVKDGLVALLIEKAHRSSPFDWISPSFIMIGKV